MSTPQTIVVKIGSSLLVNEENLTLRYVFMHGLLSDIKRLQKQGICVVLVSSGSVAMGLGTLKCDPAKASLVEKQAAAACGQPLLLHAYKQVAQEYGYDIAQVLVTLEDMEKRKRYLNSRNTLLELCSKGILPIVNENDSVATAELKVGDNDRLAAKVAQMVQAEKLVILTSIDGLYDRSPSQADAQFVDEVEDVSSYLEATAEVSALGSGGMYTKMQAANMAQTAGIETIIAEGTMDRPIQGILENERRFTRCIAAKDTANAEDLWITNRLQVTGSLIIDNGCAKLVCTSGQGIKADDIRAVHGSFAKGDIVHLYDEDGEEFARGMANFSAEEALMLARDEDNAIAPLFGPGAPSDVVTADNMVVLEDQHLTHEAPAEDELKTA